MATTTYTAVRLVGRLSRAVLDISEAGYLLSIPNELTQYSFDLSRDLRPFLTVCCGARQNGCLSPAPLCFRGYPGKGGGGTYGFLHQEKIYHDLTGPQ